MLWNGFRTAVDTEILWLLPERDTIDEPMTVALRELQTRLSKLLEQAMPEQGPELQNTLASLSLRMLQGGR